MLGIAALAQLPLAGFPSVVTARHIGGGVGRRRRTIDNLEARLKEQRDSAFNKRRWREMLEEAAEAAREAEAAEADRAANETAAAQRKKALADAARAAEKAARDIDVASERQVKELTSAVVAAAGAKQFDALLSQSRKAQRIADVVAATRARDDEDEVELLLLS